MKTLRTLTLIAAAALATPCWADFEAARAAYQRKDADGAFTLMKEAAQQGEARAYSGLGSMYLNGIGTAKNPAEARKWFEKGAAAGDVTALNYLTDMLRSEKKLAKAKVYAEQSASKNDKFGQYFYYLIVSEENDQKRRNDKGQIDRDKYMAMAKRSLNERADDRKAFTLLSRAAETGLRDAMVAASGELLYNSSPQNKKRALQLMRQVPEPSDFIKKNIKQLESVPVMQDSYTSVRTFQEVTDAAGVMALMVKNHPTKTCDKAPKVVKIKISKAMEGAQYLPIDAKLLKDFYMLSGNWQEAWEFDVCGTNVPVLVDFQSDGGGGAYYQIKKAAQ